MRCFLEERDDKRSQVIYLNNYLIKESERFLNKAQIVKKLIQKMHDASKYFMYKTIYLFSRQINSGSSRL